VFDHTSILKMIEAVWDVPPVAAREKSNDVGNLLEVLGSEHQPTAPALPNPGYVTPSSLCMSSTDPSGSSSSPDDEPTVFLAMINSGMLTGFPGYPG
jgi:hypothetical protein